MNIGPSEVGHRQRTITTMIKMSMTNISGLLLGFFLVIDNILLPGAGLAHKDFVQTKFRGNFVKMQ